MQRFPAGLPVGLNCHHTAVDLTAVGVGMSRGLHILAVEAAVLVPRSEQHISTPTIFRGFSITFQWLRTSPYPGG